MRAECDRVGALLIFDEVITGFRVARGGAQQLFGVTPDLSTFGKVIGGGLPVGAFGGRADVMDVLAPDGPVYQAGTLSGNPLATAAGCAALDQLTDDVYRALAERVARFATGLEQAIAGAGLPVRVPVAATLLGLYFGDAPAVDYETAKQTDEKVYAAFFHEMLDRGVALAPGAYEVLFPGTTHRDDLLDQVVDTAAEAAQAVASAPDPAGSVAEPLRGRDPAPSAAGPWLTRPSGFGDDACHLGDGAVHDLGHAQLVVAQQVRHDAQHPVHERVRAHAHAGELAHQGRVVRSPSRRAGPP